MSSEVPLARCLRILFPKVGTLMGATELVQGVLVVTLDVIDILFLFIVLKKGYFSVGMLNDFFSKKKDSWVT